MSKCRRCGRELTSKKSIDRGIGTACLKREREEANIENQYSFLPGSDQALNYIKETGQWEEYQKWKTKRQ